MTPVATYRFQLTPELGFAEVIGLLDHVGRLGASHVYLSPIAQAVPESTHGYDVVDHTEVRAEFGGADGFERLLDAAHERAMAVVIDHVPNHVASTRPDLNPPWWALLRDGQGSPADDWFDVDWDLTHGRVILPVLGGSLDEVIGDGQLVVADDALVLYGARRLPIADGTAELPLDELVAAQHYRLQHWREPERNVRRFFTIDDLVAVRVEHEGVAAVVDTLPERYAGRPGFGGVRVDHIDGLADPAGYLRGLRSRIGDDALLYVEKIVAPGEWLPSDWPVDGTTGYEFIRSVDHLVLAAEAEPELTRSWVALSADARPFHDHEAQARREVAATALAPDIERLQRLVAAAIEVGDDAEAIADEVVALVTELPRYRTYLPDDPDAAHLIGAISEGPVASAILHPATAQQIEVRTRWQQITGPVMAKGAEDRSFYRYLRLASLCEVGGDPGAFGLTGEQFHRENLERQASWPLALLASSTHDTKRSEDVRARSAAMTWRVVDRRFPLANGQHAMSDDLLALVQPLMRELAARTGLDLVTVWLAVQTAMCTPDLDPSRLTEYLVKAAREAAVHTTWEEPSPDFEDRLPELATLTIDNSAVRSLGLEAIAPGISLAATTLRLTAPGVPDVYQGSEAFTFQLVDPDNRVPPDWAALAGQAGDERTVAELWAHAEPAVKAVLVRTLLELRRRRASSFGPDGSYVPIETGSGIVGYARGDDVVVAVRRGLAVVDGPFAFPTGSWYDVLDPDAPTLSGTVEAASLVGSGADFTLPVAVFERD